nr:hypothetical protein BaRGS_025805 [Batillaria attramentaria]
MEGSNPARTTGTAGNQHCATVDDKVSGLHGLKVTDRKNTWKRSDAVYPEIEWTRFYYQGPDPSVDFVCDDASITELTTGALDVNNENLHGEWFQAQLGDPDYDLELFRIAHHADPQRQALPQRLSVCRVRGVHYSRRYLEQTRRFKSANVGLYGIGVQCHFPDELEPNPDIIKHRLDVLAQAGVPIWVTELDVMSKNETTRADFYEKALRALYGHPALTPAGRRVLDLLENQWMTDETHVLSQSSDQFTVRGFHGDYEVRVRYQGRELHNLRKTFTLGKGGQTVNVSVHV